MARCPPFRQQMKAPVVWARVDPLASPRVGYVLSMGRMNDEREPAAANDRVKSTATANDCRIRVARLHTIASLLKSPNSFKNPEESPPISWPPVQHGPGDYSYFEFFHRIRVGKAGFPQVVPGPRVGIDVERVPAGLEVLWRLAEECVTELPAFGFRL